MSLMLYSFYDLNVLIFIIKLNCVFFTVNLCKGISNSFKKRYPEGHRERTKVHRENNRMVGKPRN